MKPLKLTPIARADIEHARARALPKTPDYSEELDEQDLLEMEGSPYVVNWADSLLKNTDLWARSRSEPLLFPSSPYDYENVLKKRVRGTLFLFQDCIYDVIGEFLDDQKSLLVRDAADREQKRFATLRTKFNSP